MSRQVLLDVDPGCDDAIMIAMALGADAIDVVGLTTVAGNSTIENTTTNALAILEFADRPDVPVAKGCGRPLIDDLATAEWVHGPDGLRGDLPEPSIEPVGHHAADFIVEQAHEHGDDLTICAVGPLTNLALALAKEPDLPAIVDAIYLMGGAALVAGNATPMAEANFHNDPHAAARVIQDADPWMVGLDVTNEATVATETTDAYLDGTAAEAVIGAWLEYPPEITEFVDADGYAIHDAAVVAHLTDDVLGFEPFYLEIDTTGGPCHGAVVCDKHGVMDEEPNAQVALDIDVEAFRDAFRSSIDAVLA
ncbi:MAG: nucleoside hydrolase [Halobacteriales archaeon]|nr:nucleoside hydrolase [Halobacteriales archaeon]